MWHSEKRIPFISHRALCAAEEGAPSLAYLPFCASPVHTTREGTPLPELRECAESAKLSKWHEPNAFSFIFFFLSFSLRLQPFAGTDSQTKCCVGFLLPTATINTAYEISCNIMSSTNTKEVGGVAEKASLTWRRQSRDKDMRVIPVKKDLIINVLQSLKP